MSQPMMRNCREFPRPSGPCGLPAATESPLLTAEEERGLAAAIAEGDLQARDRMILSNLRLVIKIARGYLGRGLALDDLIGEGNVGLIRAVEEFDPDFGTRFSTYASYWIKQAIRQALTNTTATIRLPAHMVCLLTRWKRLERSLARELGEEPSFEAVAARLGLSDAQRDLVRRARRSRTLKLESSRSGEGSWSPDDTADTYEAPESVLERADEQRLLRERLTWLDARERLIVVLRFGLNGEPAMTLKDVGRRLGVTREWVRKIEHRAVRKLNETSLAQPAQSAGAAGKRVKFAILA